MLFPSPSPAAPVVPWRPGPRLGRMLYPARDTAPPPILYLLRSQALAQHFDHVFVCATKPIGDDLCQTFEDHDAGLGMRLAKQPQNLAGEAQQARIIKGHCR